MQTISIAFRCIPDNHNDYDRKSGLIDYKSVKRSASIVNQNKHEKTIEEKRPSKETVKTLEKEYHESLRGLQCILVTSLSISTKKYYEVNLKVSALGILHLPIIMKSKSLIITDQHSCSNISMHTTNVLNLDVRYCSHEYGSSSFLSRLLLLFSSSCFSHSCGALQIDVIFIVLLDSQILVISNHRGQLCLCVIFLHYFFLLNTFLMRP